MNVHGWELEASTRLQQYGIAQAKRKKRVKSGERLRHFTLLYALEGPVQGSMKALCNALLVNPTMVGALYKEEQQHFPIHHEPGFCQPCKTALRKRIGHEFTHLATSIGPELYPGQPLQERFMLFCADRPAITPPMQWDLYDERAIYLQTHNYLVTEVLDRGLPAELWVS